MSILDDRSRPGPTERDPGWRQILAALRVVLVVLVVACLLWLVVQLRTIILLLVLSIFFAYLIAPLVDFVNRPFTLKQRQRRLSTGLAIGVVYLLLIGVLTIALAWLVPRLSQQATQMASQAPSYLQAIQARSDGLTGSLDRIGLPPDSRQTVQNAFAGIGRSIEESVRGFLVGLVGILAYLPWLVLIPILAFFLLKDAQSFREMAICLLPEGRVRVNGIQLFDRINEALAAYIRAQLLACVIIGAAVTVGFALLRVPYALVLGALAGLAEFVPLVGPFVIAVAAAILAALHTPVLALWVLLFLGVLRIVEDYVVYPRLVGTVVDIHPLAVVLAVLAGAELAGVAGVFLSVPVVAILSAAYRQYLAYARGRTASAGGATTMAPPVSSPPNP
jgi:predicted PurR-regulated permease PerM